MGGSLDSTAAVTTPLVSIHTITGGTYYACADDIENARAEGLRDVPLCTSDGDPVIGAVGRGTLRLSTILAADVRPHDSTRSLSLASTHSIMKPADEALLTEAKRTVDLPGFFALHGFEPVREKDSRRHRILAGPGGEKVRVRVAQNTGDWVWEDLRHGGGGNIYHVCTRILGMSTGQAMGTIRKAAAAPPSALPFGRGGRATATPAPAPINLPRSLPVLDEEGTAYLVDARSLDPATVDAFRHSLASLPDGVVVAPHNTAHDGEQKGPHVPSRFYGNSDDGPGRGRSLWIALPHDQGVPEQLIVADAFLDALSAWECLDPDMQPTVAVASTGGTPSAAGTEKLGRALARMVQAHGERIVPVILDASDVGEADEERRAAWLRGMAEQAGVEYRRLSPDRKDWNEHLAVAKHEAREAVIAARSGEDDPSQSAKPHESEGVRIESRRR